MIDQRYPNRWRHMPYTLARRKAWDAYQEQVVRRRAERIAYEAEHPPAPHTARLLVVPRYERRR